MGPVANRIFDPILQLWSALTGTDGAAYVKDGTRTGLGYQKLTGLDTAKALTVPAGARLALLRTEGQDIRFRGDGVAPTASEGLLLKTTDGLFPYTGDLSNFRAIETTASATLFICYFR